MKTVFKYTIPLTFLTEFRFDNLPQDAKILSLGLDPQDRPSIWVQTWTEWSTDPLQHENPRTFVAVGTGHEILPGWTYIGTWRDVTSTFMWHLYETTTRK